VEAALTRTLIEQLDEEFTQLEAQNLQELAEQGVAPDRVRCRRRLMLKVAGSDTALTIPWESSLSGLTRHFDDAHRRHFGFHAGGDGLIVESAESEAIAASVKIEEPEWTGGDADAGPVSVRDVWFEGEAIATPVFKREELASGWSSPGPAIIVEANATTVIEPDWQAEISEFGHLIASRLTARPGTERLSTDADPIMLEVFNNLFMHSAEQMGVVLENTAHSVNIKERLDFSCAIFDSDGDLIANAPHIPVHLGSMGDSVQTILRQRGEHMRPGDTYLLNAPYNGGTHLPDVTVVTPVFDEAGKELIFSVACRAHHADIGGITPGSMPARSGSIQEEGVLFDDVMVVAAGEFQEEAVRDLLASGPYPARNPDQNIADLKAQVAANMKGVSELEAMVAHFSLPIVHAYMDHIKRNAEECVRKTIETLHEGHWSVGLDGGEIVRVAIGIDTKARTASIDFRGTSEASAGNFNAPASIARAAILYVFRTLVTEAIPLNAGCLRPLIIRLPEGSLVNPDYPAAVVAGNVETSQCITDALLAALGACAASQGTMNNFTFGNDDHQYYETICGGAGAGPTFDGATAVHTHMTNSRLTDPEVLEWRHPVRVRRFCIRRGTGGEGLHPGGDGVIRELEFLEPMKASILSNRRRIPPFGLEGGGDGKAGRNYIVRASGQIEELGATAEAQLEPNDCFVIETPGGGGYGSSVKAD